MPIPLARGGVTMTGPSTGRLSMPVSFIVFHGFSRGWPMLTDNSFMTRPYAATCRRGDTRRSHLVAEPVGPLGIVGADHPGQSSHCSFRIKAFIQPRAKEIRQRAAEQRRAEVIQLGQPERVRGIQELPERRQLKRLGEQRRRAGAQVVGG